LIPLVLRGLAERYFVRWAWAWLLVVMHLLESGWVAGGFILLILFPFLFHAFSKWCIREGQHKTAGSWMDGWMDSWDKEGLKGQEAGPGLDSCLIDDEYSNIISQCPWC
jgi:hypothetical protein